MKNLIKKIVSPSNLAAVIAILFVTGATALAAVPAYKNWLVDPLNNIFTKDAGTNVTIGLGTSTPPFVAKTLIATLGPEHPFQVRIGPTFQPALLVQNTGDVGIGADPPGAKLHVVQAAAGDALRVYDQSADLTPFVVDANGNVGIQEPSPVNVLDVGGNAIIGAGYVGANMASPANGLLVQGDTGIGLPIGTVGVGATLRLHAPANVGAFRVDDAAFPDATPFVIFGGADPFPGRVGIGTTAPNAKVHAVRDNAVANSFEVDDAPGGDATPFIIGPNGNTGIGAAPAGAKLKVNNDTGMAGVIDATVGANVLTRSTAAGGFQLDQLPQFLNLMCWGTTGADPINQIGDCPGGLFQPSGTPPWSPNWTLQLQGLDIVKNTQLPVIHLGPTGTTGAFLAAGTANDFAASAGAYFNGVNWIAAANSATALDLNGSGSGDIWLWGNSGLTPGSAFTPSPRLISRRSTISPIPPFVASNVAEVPAPTGGGVGILVVNGIAIRDVNNPGACYLLGVVSGSPQLFAPVACP